MQVKDEDILAVARINALMALRKAPREIKAQAEDVFQEACLGAVKAAKKFRSDGGAAFRTYAGRASYGAAVDSYRRGKYPRQMEEIPQNLTAESEPDSQWHRDRLLQQVIDALPVRHRRIIIAVYFRGHTQIEIATQRRVRVQRIYALHAEAIEALRQSLKRYNLQDLI